MSCFELEWWVDLPKLKTIILGNHAFETQECIELSLEWWVDLPKLKTIILGNHAFETQECIELSGTYEWMNECVVSYWIDLPCLETICLGWTALSGLNSGSSLVMKSMELSEHAANWLDLPSLKTLTSKGFSFHYIQSVELLSIE